MATLEGEGDAASSKKHIRNYQKARAIFRKEQEQLRGLLADDYAVERMLLNHATEREMNKRDEAMEQNLEEQLVIDRLSV